MLNKEKTTGVMPEDAIFALDIGTRTIIGLVGVQKDERFFVHGADIVSHESRAMMDGQIHDIMKVVQGVEKVKNSLEKKLGYRLTRVSIAAAGRVLKTCQMRIEREIDEGLEIDGQLISALEMEAVQKAQMKIEDSLGEAEKDSFYCVGYSVVNYYLNDYIITSLLGHRGTKVGVEVLATFLPHMVVDSLYSVIERTGLEVTHLTLEPIAALNLAIPQELRLLNLALVDVGAGTSDIAITKSGAVTAYAMVPLAGDELTEAVAHNFLVDFNTAEHIKIALSNADEPVTFTDILDNTVTVSPEEIDNCLQPVIEQLAGTIAGKILEYNGGKAPNAVFLVGGGSQVKGLAPSIASIIGLSKERVAIRNRSVAKNVILEEDILKGPESITSLGILVTTAMSGGQDFFYVTVNEKKVRMYNSRRMTVSDALILAGFSADEMICRSGRSIKFTINGHEKTVRGSLGKPAEIYLNGSSSSLNARISPGDTISVTPAENGFDAEITASDLVRGCQPATLHFSGLTREIWPKVLVNGEEADLNMKILSGTEVEIVQEFALEEIAQEYDLVPLGCSFEVNGMPGHEKTIVKPGDQVTAVQEELPEEFPAEAPEDVQQTETAMLETAAASEMVKEFSAGTGNDLFWPGGITVTVNGKPINLPPKSTGYMFIDIFNYIDFDLTAPEGIIALKLNGNDANYTDMIKAGDLIDIYWKK